MARRLTARSLPAWIGDLPVYERTLANGLKALVLPRPRAPVVVCDLYYPAGSVDEPPGKSGIAHFLEHMLFKGTDLLPKGEIDRLAFLAAGHANAETCEDNTHYWFALPRDRWELALAIEADRMMGARFDAREIEAECFVIAEERARELDSAFGRLDQAHLLMSYLVHPYRNPILGWPEDVQGLTPADLEAFYQRHYRPAGAVLIVVGDFVPEAALDRIADQFGRLPAVAASRPSSFPAEPPQNGKRAFTLNESEGVPRAILGWHTVASRHADSPALGVLADLLTFGRRSRLWDRLVERDRLVTWVDASQEGARLAGQFVMQLEAVPGASPEAIEAAIQDEILSIIRSGPTAAELLRSRRRLEAAWRWEQDELSGLASGLGHVALWGDWRAWQEEHRASLAVTADEVGRAAAALADTVLTVGWSLPRPSRRFFGPALPSGLESGRPTTPRPVSRIVSEPLHLPAVLAVTGRPATLSDYQPRRTRLPNGLRLLIERRPETGTVALELHVDAGVLREEKPGVAHLAGRLREEGSAGRTAEAVAEAIDDVGGTIDMAATGVSLRVRAEDLALAIELMAETTRDPAFPARVLPWIKERVLAEFKADYEDPAYHADLAFRGLVYGRHPLGRDPRGGPRQIEPLTVADIRAHQRRFFHPDNAFLVAVGDFDPRRLRGLVNTHFGNWEPSGAALPAWPRPVEHRRAAVRRIMKPGEQVQIVIGHLGVSRDDPDYDALAVLDHILGSGPGFTDRLGRLLRDELGLTYSVGGGFCDSADVVAGVFRISLGTGPADASRAIAVIHEQIAAMQRGEFDAGEVERARGYLAGAWVFEYQTVAQRAERLLELERMGLPLDEPLNWPERISRVSLEDVRRAARKHLDPDGLCVVEVGPCLDS